MELATIVLNDCFQVVAPYFNTLIYWNSVAVQYSAIRGFRDIRQLELLGYGMCSILGPSIWVLLMTLILKISKISEEALNTWKKIKWENPQVAVCMKKSQKFWRPFQFHFGRFYVMKPIRLIFFFHTIIWGVSKALFFIKIESLNTH